MPSIAPHQFKARQGGAWKDPLTVHVRSGGTVKAGKEVWYKRGGVWAKVWAAGPQTPTMTPLAFSNWNGAWTATATWALAAGTPALAPTEVVWTVNGVADAPVTVPGTTVSATRVVPPNATVSCRVVLTDLNGGKSDPAVDARLSPPGAATGLAVTSVDADTVRLTATLPAGTEKLRLYRSVSGAAETSQDIVAGPGPFSRDDDIGNAASVAYRLQPIGPAAQGAPLGPISTVNGQVLPTTGPSWGVTSWTPTLINVAVTPVPGFTASQYRMVRTSDGAVIAGPTASTAIPINTAQDTVYTWACEGLYGTTWVRGPARTLTTGHDAYSVPWQSAATPVALRRDQMGGPVVPDGCVCQALTVNVRATNTGSMTSASRQLAWVFVGIKWSDTGPHASPWNEYVTQVANPFDGNKPGPINAGPGMVGLTPSGTGWSSAGGSGTIYEVTGTITAHGIRNIPAVGNSIT